MFFLVYSFLFVGILADDVTYYETFSGKTLNTEELKQYVDRNLTFWCTNKYEACNASEWRRLDLTCNNLQFPHRGPMTPYINDLPLNFAEDNGPAKLQSGEEMEPARKTRMETLPEGFVPDQQFTILFVHYKLFAIANQAAFHDTMNYVRWRPYCCKPEGKKDPMCFPMKVPLDDAVHQFSDIRCLNMTKPLTFQSQGCIDNKTTPQRINSASTFLDLTMLYGFDDSFRTKEDGLLQVSEDENGRIWPVSGSEDECFLNTPPKETRCFKKRNINSLFGVTFMVITFWRHHNHIARQLKEVNPSWDDEELFQTARDINIATFSQIFIYEHQAAFMGTRNLLRDGVMSSSKGFRNIYREDMEPQMSLEYTYALRWGHTIQPGKLELFDESGCYLSQLPIVNVTKRTGFYSIGKNMEGVTQGSIRQPAARNDHIVDPIVSLGALLVRVRSQNAMISQNGLAVLQRAFDIASADLVKGPLQGIAPYVKYRELCTGRSYTTFKDLHRDMEPQYVEILKNKYHSVLDVPLLLGIWLEKLIPGGNAPRTLYCIAVKQLKRFMQYDRHWYENPDRPNAFTSQQLGEIRKASVARLFCDVGDSITHIQPKAFLREGPYNRRVSCEKIPRINYTAWQSC